MRVYTCRWVDVKVTYTRRVCVAGGGGGGGGKKQNHP